MARNFYDTLHVLQDGAVFYIADDRDIGVDDADYPTRRAAQDAINEWKHEAALSNFCAAREAGKYAHASGYPD